MSKPRLLSIYERNQLLKYSYKESDLLTKGNLPVEYLTKHVEFAGIELEVDARALIPRVETEELVEIIKQFLIANRSKFINKTANYLEVGTGSGAISVALYDFMQKQRLAWMLQVSDISMEALALARQNFRRFWSKEQIDRDVSFLVMDLLGAMSDQVFDVIVANLPYLPSLSLSTLDESVRNFEPHLALDGGKDGFVLINQLLEQVWQRRLLSDKGKIFLEVDSSHTMAFLQNSYAHLLQRYAITTQTDQFGRQRFLILELL